MTDANPPENTPLALPDLALLKTEVGRLQQEIERLRAERAQLEAEQRQLLSRLTQEALRDLEKQRQTLQIAVEQLEKRQERLQREMRTTFAGASQELAVRVQGFKDYLMGSLQDLVTSVEQLDLVPAVPPTAPEPAPDSGRPAGDLSRPQLAEQTFADQTQFIRELLEQYRNHPDYYGPPWRFRRTFEPVHSERVSQWFFTQGGRGAIRGLGSRLQNILVASAVMSILRELYGDELHTFVLASTPERLGEWRRGLQDCLGLARGDFSTEGGVGLFESTETLVIKADRVEQAGLVPFVLVDEAEEGISLSLLQFPLWLAFAPDPQTLKRRARDEDEFDFRLF
ncbi:MAG: DUF3086 domain-containing protein [Gloeomargaritaceae cyanobacterium C42_A2020_066]|nr:DUF3086 domain-containing protein [Gloeomargaritaceae cyanobacterium C42_A2020_066]